MENIEQLKQENTKLQERLNNAAKFFREQKAQIETLTKENEILVEKTKTYEHKIDNLENNNDDVQKLETKIDELEKTITSKDQAHKVLQDTYNEVFAEKEKLEKQIKEFEKFEAETINVKVPELQEKLSSLQHLHDDLGVEYDKLNAKYNELINENKKVVEEQKEEIKKLTALDIDYVNQINKYKEQIPELQEKIDKLNNLYDNCENEKLAIQADYDSLNDKLKNIELDIVNKDENIKYYQEKLYDENILRFNKNDINDFCDYVLDFFKDKNIKFEEGQE